MSNVFNPEPVEAPPAAPRAPVAWQPFTFRGVAAFASASYMRLFWVQIAFALCAAGVIVWALNYTWVPVVRSAVRNLPNEAPVRTGRIVHPPSTPPVLAESRHLGVVLRIQGATTAAGSDLRIEFLPESLRVCSLFGCYASKYPKGRAIYLTRQEAIPWWGAWQPILLGSVVVSSGLFFLAAWTVLATALFLFLRLYAYFADRELTLGGAWRLAAATLLPASLGLIVVIILYALGLADLIRLLLAVPGHLLVAVVYLIFAPLRLPRIGTVPNPSANPFKPA